MSTESIRFEDVQAAVMRCLAVHPPVDFALHRDASRLVDLFARMSYQKVHEVQPDQMPPDVLALLQKWGGTADSVAGTRARY
jgi:hypothetical protein